MLIPSQDYFRDVEQAAFSPGSLVPGIEAAPDPLLQWRMFFYRDAQYHRLGSANIHQIPVNCPFMAKYGYLKYAGTSYSSLTQVPFSRQLQRHHAYRREHRWQAILCMYSCGHCHHLLSRCPSSPIAITTRLAVPQVSFLARLRRRCNLRIMSCPELVTISTRASHLSTTKCANSTDESSPRRSERIFTIILLACSK